MGNPEVLQFILKRPGTIINQTDSLGRTPLMFAGWSGCEVCMGLLRDAGAIVTVVDKSERNFLHYFCMSRYANDEGDRPFFEWALEENLHPFAFDVDGFCPAHYAARQGNLWVFQRFFDAFNFPTDLDTRVSCDTSLHLATANGHFNLVAYLLENGANRYCANKKGELPMDYALDQENATLISLLGDTECKTEPTFWTLVRSGDAESLLGAIEERQQSRRQRRSNSTASLTSSSRSKSRMIDTSEVAGGEDEIPGVKSKRKRTRGKTHGVSSQQFVNAVLLWSAARMRLDLVEHILSLKLSNTSFTTESNLSILNVMCAYSFEDIHDDPKYLTLLDSVIRKGGNVNSRPSTGITCLHFAALNGNLPALKWCLDNGAFPNCVNTLGMSELHFARSEERRVGKECDIPCRSRWSPYH